MSPCSQGDPGAVHSHLWDQGGVELLGGRSKGFLGRWGFLKEVRFPEGCSAWWMVSRAPFRGHPAVQLQGSLVKGRGEEGGFFLIRRLGLPSASQAKKPWDHITGITASRAVLEKHPCTCVLIAQILPYSYSTLGACCGTFWSWVSLT